MLKINKNLRSILYLMIIKTLCFMFMYEGIEKFNIYIFERLFYYNSLLLNLFLNSYNEIFYF